MKLYSTKTTNQPTSLVLLDDLGLASGGFLKKKKKKANPLRSPAQRGWCTLTRLHEVEGSPCGLFWDELSESAPRFNFSMDMSLQKREERELGS